MGAQVQTEAVGEWDEQGRKEEASEWGSLDVIAAAATSGDSEAEDAEGDKIGEPGGVLQRLLLDVCPLVAPV